ncbi:hypothetical protein ACRRTK_010235 [Alexandromys fortis]
MEIISRNYGTCQRVCTHMGLCLREAGTTSQQRAGPPNILLWNMMVVIVFQLVPCNFQKEKEKFLLV